MNTTRSSDKSVSVKEYFNSLKPRVYAWQRNGVYLYIGMSLKGIARIGKHGIIGKVEPLLETDYFDFWFCETRDEAEQLERGLIKLNKPKYNKMFNPDFENYQTVNHRFGGGKRRHCKGCLEIYTVPRSGHEFCPKCLSK
jgi:hypothetical protein